MKLSEYRQRIQQVKKDLEVAHAQVMLSLALNAIALIKARVANEGVNAQGESFGEYSTKPMLVGKKSFRNKSGANEFMGSKTKRRALEWRTIKRNGKIYRLAIIPGGYKQVREMSKLQVKHIDFSFTGRMMKNIAVVKHDRTHALIAPKSEDNKKKLVGNSERFGRILELSQSEWALLQEKYDLQIVQIFRTRGL